MKFQYPIGDMALLIDNVLLIHLPELRSLDLGMDYYGTSWSMGTAVVPLTYLRVTLPGMGILFRLISTQPLPNTLRQLHIRICDSYTSTHRLVSMSDPLIRMVNLHTFTLMEKFCSTLTIEWTVLEMLTSSNVMPNLRHAYMCFY